jgi:hypothetical protein
VTRGVLRVLSGPCCPDDLTSEKQSEYQVLMDTRSAASEMIFSVTLLNVFGQPTISSGQYRARHVTGVLPRFKEPCVARNKMN